MTPEAIAITTIWTLLAGSGVAVQFLNLRDALGDQAVARRKERRWSGNLIANRDVRNSIIRLSSSVLAFIVGIMVFLIPTTAPEPLRIALRVVFLIVLLLLVSKDSITGWWDRSTRRKILRGGGGTRAADSDGGK